MSTSITISKQIAIKDEGVVKTSDVNSIDFTGAGVTATNVGNAVTVNVPQNLIQTLDESILLTLTTQSLNFIGTGVTATAVGNAVTVNVPGSAGGGGIHILTKPISGRTYSIRTDSSSASSSAVSAANTIYLSPFIPANSITISNLQINVVSLAAGASARILVYSDSNGVPSSKLIESTTLDCSTSGAKTFTTSYTFTAGTTYWLGVYTNNASFQMSTMSLANTIPISTNGFGTAFTNVTAAATFGSAPTTLGSTSLVTASMYVINLTAA